MKEELINLPSSKKIYFASDFHLGVPNHAESIDREKKIVSWLESIRKDAHSIYLLGDIFDFWFEYRHAIPKGFIRLQGKLAELRDAGIPIYLFTGNHDMWMFDYFPSELGIPIYREPILLKVGSQKLVVGHGDGLGPNETSYKILKWFFISDYIYMREYQNYLFLLDKNEGIHMFNSLGNYVKTIGEKDIISFGFLGEEIYYTKDNTLFLIDLYTNEKRALPLSVACRSALVTDDTLYAVGANTVTILDFKP